jgi:hypothetical protein
VLAAEVRGLFPGSDADFSPLRAWASFLQGGGRLAIGLAIAGVASGLARRWARSAATIAAPRAAAAAQRRRHATGPHAGAAAGHAAARSALAAHAAHDVPMLRPPRPDPGALTATRPRTALQSRARTGDPREHAIGAGPQDAAAVRRGCVPARPSGGLRIDLSERSSADAVRRVASGATDVAVFEAGTPKNALCTLPCRENGLALVVAATHPLASRCCVREDARFIDEHAMLDEGTALTDARGQFDAVCRMVWQGIGITTLPVDAIAPQRPCHAVPTS